MHKGLTVLYLHSRIRKVSCSAGSVRQGSAYIVCQDLPLTLTGFWQVSQDRLSWQSETKAHEFGYRGHVIFQAFQKGCQFLRIMRSHGVTLAFKSMDPFDNALCQMALTLLHATEARGFCAKSASSARSEKTLVTQVSRARNPPPRPHNWLPPNRASRCIIPL